MAYLNIMLQATMVLFFFGLLHLSFKYGLSAAFDYGFYPYWKMAVLKLVIAAFIVYFIKRLIMTDESNV